jgi:hypothetical protein
VVIEKEGDIAALDHAGDVFCALDEHAFTGIGESQQDRGDVSGAEHLVKRAGEGSSVLDLRRDQIKPLTRLVGSASRGGERHVKLMWDGRFNHGKVICILPDASGGEEASEPL